MQAQYVVDRKRWVFEDYVVYAQDRKLAELIHDRVKNETHARAMFGMTETPAGAGYWVRILRKDD